MDKNPLRRSFLPKPVTGPKKTTTARKELNFEQPDFEFAKPKAPPVPTHPQSVAKQVFSLWPFLPEMRRGSDSHIKPHSSFFLL